MKGQYFVAIAVVVFLLFLVATGPREILCRPAWYTVECVRIDNSGRTISSKINSRVEAAAQKLAARSEKLGQKCTVLPLPIKECPWDAYF